MHSLNKMIYILILILLKLYILLEYLILLIFILFPKINNLLYSFYNKLGITLSTLLKSIQISIVNKDINIRTN